MTGNSDYIVVIRSSNERTEALCQKIVQKEAEGQQVVTIHEKPFKKALEKGFRIAIDAETKWLITVDADMLILPGAFKVLREEAEKMPEHYLQLQGRILDKISGKIRKAGPRIYRVALLEEALELSRNYTDSIRPEALIVGSMGKKGHHSRYIDFVTCLHDYEQYYKDLYRKTFVHARKHEEFVSAIIQCSVENLKKDPDFRVILKALWDGLMFEDEISIDTRLFTDKADKALLELQMDEKSLIPASFDYRAFLKDTLPEEMSSVHAKEIDFHDQPVPEIPFFKRVQRTVRRKGLMNGIISGIGSFLIFAGNRLK